MAKAKEITLVNTGLAAIYIERDRVMPDEEIEVDAELLEAQSIQSLIARGEMTIKDNTKLNKEIIEKVAAKRKADPFASKSLKELEDGGEY